MPSSGTDILEEIRRIVIDETKYMRPYFGEVLFNVDPIEPKSGAIQALVDELGWSDPTSVGRCLPRFMHGMDVPNIGETVMIYFMDGDPERPVYQGQVAEIFGNVPSSFDGLPSTRILHESPLLGNLIKTDDLTGEITIDPALFTILGSGIEPMALGTQLFVFLTALVTAINANVVLFNTHVHGDATPPVILSPGVIVQLPVPTPSPGVLSVKHFLD